MQWWTNEKAGSFKWPCKQHGSVLAQGQNSTLKLYNKVTGHNLAFIKSCGAIQRLFGATNVFVSTQTYRLFIIGWGRATTKGHIISRPTRMRQYSQPSLSSSVWSCWIGPWRGTGPLCLAGKQERLPLASCRRSSVSSSSVHAFWCWRSYKQELLQLCMVSILPILNIQRYLSIFVVLCHILVYIFIYKCIYL